MYLICLVYVAKKGWVFFCINCPVKQKLTTKAYKYCIVLSKRVLAKTVSMSEYGVCSFILVLALSLLTSPAVCLKPDLSHPHAVSLTFGWNPAFLVSHYYGSCLTDFHSALKLQRFVFYMLVIRIQWVDSIGGCILYVDHRLPYILQFKWLICFNQRSQVGWKISLIRSPVYEYWMIYLLNAIYYTLNFWPGIWVWIFHSAIIYQGKSPVLILVALLFQSH